MVPTLKSILAGGEEILVALALDLSAAAIKDEEGNLDSNLLLLNTIDGSSLQDLCMSSSLPGVFLDGRIHAVLCQCILRQGAAWNSQKPVEPLLQIPGA